MTDVPFHLTRDGARFYQHTAPELVRQLALLNENLARLIELQQPKETDHGQGHQEDDRDRAEEARPEPQR